MSEYFGKDVPKLGFGLMRLPRLEDGHTIDVETMKKMVDLFLASGFKYFDTAYVYDNGDSERAAKAALVDRYPRESFYLVSKLNARAAKNEEEAKKELDVSLERTGAGYFDIYLLHAIDGNNIGKYDEYHLWDYLKEMKAAGKIHHYGFSFHGTPELLDELLTKHPDVDLVQLQLNYADWENPSVQSRRCYETVRKHGKGITVMEPVKGGTLAKPPKKVEALFRSVDPDASPASWAIRYIEAGSPFKFCAKKEWSGDFTGLGEDSGYTVDGGNCAVAENGVYMIYVDTDNKKLVVEPAKVHGIGGCWGGAWDSAMAGSLFEAKDGKLVGKTTSEGELRLYAESSAATSDWWTREFVILDGQIAYRGNGGDQERVNVPAGATITLDFNAGTGTIE